MGLCSYYRRFIKGFSKLEAPLTNLKKMRVFMWSEEVQTSFERLKQVMYSYLVLAIPNLSLPFTIECDASKIGVGVFIMQKGQKIAFESRKINTIERNFNIYDKEILSIMHALSKFRQYLVCGRFVVNTNHNSVRHFLG